MQAPAFQTDHPMVPVPGRVLQRRHEGPDTFTLAIEQAGGRPFPFAPGQFNMLYVFGVGEVPISISGDPAAPQRLEHTTRAVGAVTQALQRLRVGDSVGVRGPFGVPWPLEAAVGKDVLLVAGGIGLAPLRPVLLHLLAHRARFRRVVLLYGARTPADLLYADALRRWRRRRDATVLLTVDRAVGPWRGHVGVLPALLPRVPLTPRATVAMICGPEMMMHVTVRALRQRGLDAAQIYLSMERNMKCALGLCGRCQYGPLFVCKDGPVFRYDRVEAFFGIRAI